MVTVAKKIGYRWLVAGLMLGFVCAGGTNGVCDEVVTNLSEGVRESIPIALQELANWADFDNSGKVDLADLLLMMRVWQHVSTPRPHIPTHTPTPLPGVEVIMINLPNLPVGASPLRLVRIRAGSFEMGSPEDERERWGDEGPVRTVDIGYDYYMGETQITQSQWETVMGSNPSHFSECGPDCPVDNVSWYDCLDFITALNGLGLGYTFRLPSEAEWEYVARAGTSTRFSFGDALECGDECEACALSDQYMWWCGNAGDRTHPVASKLPNAWGLYGMYGNVWEWCEDDWHGNYQGAPSDGLAWIDNPRASIRVLRGGSWGSLAGRCRSASRSGGYPLYRSNYDGVRVVAGQQ